MPFGKKKPSQPVGTEPVSNAIEASSESAEADTLSPTAEKLWLDLAKMEQEVAELAQAVATRQREADQLWERTGDIEKMEAARQAGITAWRLEQEILRLAETALQRAKGELNADVTSAT